MMGDPACSESVAGYVESAVDQTLPFRPLASSEQCPAELGVEARIATVIFDNLFRLTESLLCAPLAPNSNLKGRQVF